MLSLRRRVRRLLFELKYSEPIYTIRRKFRRVKNYFKAKAITLNLFGLEKGFRNIDELVSAITYVNRMVKTLPCTFRKLYDTSEEREDLYELKTALINELLAKYRDKVTVGYLIGGTEKHIEFHDFEFWYWDEYCDYDPCDDVRKRYGSDLVKCSPVPSKDMIVYHTINWNIVNEIAMHFLKKNPQLKLMCNGFADLDFYGLIEIRYKNHRIHDVSSNLCYHAPVIKRFDFVALRWQHHPLYASRDNTLDTEEIHDLLTFMYYVYKARYIPIAKEIYWRMISYALEAPYGSVIGPILMNLGYL